MRLYLMRHADPDYGNDTITPDGHLEAAALAVRLEKERINHIFCSPLGRAKATAAYTANRLQLPVTIEDWTREVDFGGLVNDPVRGSVAPWDLNPEEILKDKIPTWDDALSNPQLKDIPIRAKLNTLQVESDRFLAALGYNRKGGVYEVVRRNSDRVALFCHGGFGLTWLSLLLHIPITLVWAGFWLPPSSVTTLLFDERTPGTATLRCIGLSDISHLYHAGIPVKPAGIIRNFD
jgi:broad specificity phosphatase PhoE